MNMEQSSLLQSSVSSISLKSGARKKKKGIPGRKRGWKKPEGKPKRPLSAYNLFFKQERGRLLHGNSSGGSLEGNSSQSTGKKIGFAALARNIAEKWKALDGKARSPFEARAAIEKVRYNQAVEEWSRSQVKKLDSTAKEASQNTMLPVMQPKISNFTIQSPTSAFQKDPPSRDGMQFPEYYTSQPSPQLQQLYKSDPDVWSLSSTSISDDFFDDTDPIPLEYLDDFAQEPLPLEASSAQMEFSDDSPVSLDDWTTHHRSFIAKESLKHLASVMDDECLDLMRSFLKSAGEQPDFTES